MPRTRNPRIGRAALAAFVLLPTPQDEGVPRQPELRSTLILPPLHIPGESYSTPLAGDGFFTSVFGYELEVWPDDRREFTALSGGLAWSPDLSDNELLPFGALYVFRRPDEERLFRGTFVGAFNEVLYARSPGGWGPYELVATLETFTPPFDWSDYVDGEYQEEEELIHGTIRAGMGFGYRETVAPGEPDNLFSATLTYEPGYLYFDDGSDTADDFVVPEDTFESRLHFQLRYDALERNLIELPHEGWSAGLDAVGGYRHDWEDWGRNASEDAGEEEDYGFLTGYLYRAAGLPGVDSDRHRLLTSLHAGVADDVDRFSAPRVGGGPQGDEYMSIARPTMPGAALFEFSPDHYVVSTAEYRYETLFCTYIGLVGSVSWLDRDRQRSGGVSDQDDVLGSVGLRVTTGFLGDTRIQMEVHYNEGLIRDGDYGGFGVILQIAASL